MPTYYLSTLNPSSTALGTGGDFAGSTTSQPITNSTTREDVQKTAKPNENEAILTGGR